MSLPITPEILEAAYDFLKATPPFWRWKMPESDDVVFRVCLSRDDFGFYNWDGQHHSITGSMHSLGHTSSLLSFMAHEMIHLYLKMKNLESKSHNPNIHNAAFRKRAAQVCKWHGFDPKAFY